MSEVDEPSAPGEDVAISIDPFVGRHLLREARRGKRPRYDPKADPGWAELMHVYIESAFVSGFVRIVHRYGCKNFGRRHAPATERCAHDRFLWDCLLCGCWCGMELTVDGMRELARLERELRS